MSNKGSISLIIIDNGMVEGAYLEGILDLCFFTDLPIVNFARTPGNSIPRQRQMSLEFWMEKQDTEWSLWIDTDVRVSAGGINKLWAIANSITAPVVTGVYPLNFEREGEIGEPTPSIFNQLNNPSKMTPLRGVEFDTIVKVDYAGFGCTLIHRSVIKKMWAVYENTFLFNEEHYSKELFVSEDISFFKKLKELNIPVYAHTGVVCYHIKKRFLTLEGWLK